MFEKITPDNVMMYAMKHYNNPQGDNEKEFLDDMKRFKYIKRRAGRICHGVTSEGTACA